MISVFQLHQKYNPNLVDDEDQDIDAQLRKRRLRARRLALLAMHKNNAGTPERRASFTPPTEHEAVVVNPLVPLAASFFLERAEKRRMLKKEAPAPKPEESEGTSKPVKLERQSAISATRTLNKISTIGEESETEVAISGESSRDSQRGEHKKSEESEV